MSEASASTAVGADGAKLDDLLPRRLHHFGRGTSEPSSPALPQRRGRKVALQHAADPSGGPWSRTVGARALAGSVGVVLRPGPRDDLTDVRGVRVGHHQRDGRGWLTGVTVVVPPTRTVGAVDARGGAPGTRETDALDPRNVVAHVDAVVLSGGSAYGLAAADGVMAWLEEQRRGVQVGPTRAYVVPIVPAAVIFDLGRAGHFGHRPDASFGRAAVATTALAPPRAARVGQGSVGAGTGARAGGLKGGVGSASVVVDNGVTVAALVVVNAAGGTVDRRSGRLLGAAFVEESGLPAPSTPIPPSATRCSPTCAWPFLPR